MPTAGAILTEHTYTSTVTVREFLAAQSRPLTTMEIAHGLEDRFKARLVMTRLRRTLDRLVEAGEVVASGSPRFPDRDGWPVVDGREVQWATTDLADEIAERVRAEVEARAEIQWERVTLLKELALSLTRDEREALGLVGIRKRLAEDPLFEGEGATRWSLAELRVVVDLAEHARGRDH